MLLRCCMNRNYRPMPRPDYEELSALYRRGWRMLERAKKNEGDDRDGEDHINESEPQDGNV